MKINIKLSEQEYEDLLSLVHMGLVIAKKKHKDSPRFLADVEELCLKLWQTRKVQRAKHETTN